MIRSKFGLIGIGWDVRGWQSDKQHIAVAQLEPGLDNINWLGISEPFKFNAGPMPPLLDLLIPAIGSTLAIEIAKVNSMTLAIDAPLAFPKKLTALLNNTNANHSRVPERAIDNPYGYRDCERWVHEQYNKRAGSATFDQMGNLATLAMSVSQNLTKEGFSLIPQQSTQSHRSIIEVYPALVKTDFLRNSPAIAEIDQLIPNELEYGSDEYDSAICAVMALLFQGAESQLNLPSLITKPAGLDSLEGWIYCLPRDDLKNS